MIIDCISDLHGERPHLKGGDLLIVAGDLTISHSKMQFAAFAEWYRAQNYRKKVLVAGNHDGLIQDGTYYFNHEWLGYLQDSGTEFEGLRIWGSPWTHSFEGCNPHCMAFMEDDHSLKEKWDLIPADVDILVTHSPPLGFCDYLERAGCVGSRSLRRAFDHEKFLPKLWVFGHIHEGYGKQVLSVGTEEEPRRMTIVNASIMDEDYNPTNKPIRIIL